MTIRTIPTLDISRFNSDKTNFVAELGKGYSEFGFCGIVGHGIDTELVAKAYEAIRTLFALPQDVKEQYSAVNIGGARGYTGLGIEKAKDNPHPDLKEFWHVGRELDTALDIDGLYPNVWPVEVPQFKADVYALYQALDELGRQVLSALALYLGQDEHYFDDKIDHGNSILRPLHYPPILDGDTPAVRAGAHEDINFITLLVGSEEAGLEVLTRDGEYIPVTTIPGTIVVNIGDMLQRLTNNVLPSTTHRVVNPPGDAAKHSRFSVPFFLHPNPEFMIETLATCVTEDNPNRYPQPISSNDYLTERLIEIGLIK